MSNGEPSQPKLETELKINVAKWPRSQGNHVSCWKQLFKRYFENIIYICFKAN